MALKYGSSSKSNTFKRSAFPMQSGTTSHASALKQKPGEDLKIEKDLKTQEELDKANKLLVAQETLAQNTETARLNKITREETGKKEKKAKSDEAWQAFKKSKGRDQDTKMYNEDSPEFQALSPEHQKRAKKKNVARTKAKKAEEAVDARRGTAKGQVKKQAKLDRIQGRADKTAYKKYLKKNKMKGDDSTFENWKKSDEYSPGELSKREKRLTKEVGMTPEEYEANQARKKEEFFGGLDQLGQTISRAYGPGGTGTMNVARSEMSIEKDSAKSQDLMDKLRQQRVDDYENELKEGNKVDATEQEAVTEGGEHNFENTIERNKRLEKENE